MPIANKGKFQAIRDLFERGFSSTAIINMGYAESSVFTVQRQLQAKSTSRAGDRTNANGSEDSTIMWTARLRRERDEARARAKTLGQDVFSLQERALAAERAIKAVREQLTSSEASWLLKEKEYERRLRCVRCRASLDEHLRVKGHDMLQCPPEFLSNGHIRMRRE